MIITKVCHTYGLTLWKLELIAFPFFMIFIKKLLIIYFSCDYYSSYDIFFVTALKCLYGKVPNWRRVLAYSAQLHNFFIGTNAYYINWYVWAEEASSSICLDSASSDSHTSIQ